MVSRAGSGGFSLLEAILALVILSSALSGLYSWINTDLISLRRAEAVVAAQNVLEEATRKVELLDLSRDSEGRMAIGDFDLAWKAQLVEPVAYGRAQQGVVAAYDLALYDISLTLESAGRSLGTWHTRTARHSLVRPPPDVPL